MVERINQRHGPPKAYEDHAEQGKLSKTPKHTTAADGRGQAMGNR